MLLLLLWHSGCFVSHDDPGLAAFELQIVLPHVWLVDDHCFDLQHPSIAGSIREPLKLHYTTNRPSLYR